VLLGGFLVKSVNALLRDCLRQDVLLPDALVSDLSGEVDELAMPLLLVILPVALKDLVCVEIYELAPPLSLSIVVLSFKDYLLFEVLQLPVSLKEPALELAAVIELIALHDPAAIWSALNEVAFVSFVLFGEEVLSLAIHVAILPSSLVDVATGLESELPLAMLDSSAEVSFVDTA
jgi:hypothetical protein